MSELHGLLTVDRAWKHRDLHGEQVVILVDGVEAEYCFVADDRYGYAGVYSTDGSGRRFLNATRDGVAAEILTGVVQFVTKPLAVTA
jgi:hypothetical protein